MSPMLEIVDVVKSFGSGAAEVRALTDVSLTVSPGELVAVRGPSGCGKSTLLHLAGGLEDPSAGRVLVNGRDVSTMSAGGASRVAAPRRRLRVPATQPRRRLDRDRERDAPARARRRGPARSTRPGDRRTARGRRSSRASTAIPTTSPAASSSGSRSRARSSGPAACCSPTNRRDRSTPRPATR